MFVVESPYLRTVPRPGSTRRLFCFPHAGAGASAYLGWAEALPADVRLSVVQLPGREDRIGEPPLHELPTLVDMLVAALATETGAPFALFGHSSGALLAAEVARAIGELLGAGPDRLFTACEPAPAAPRPGPPLSGLPDGELLARLRDLGGTTDAVAGNPELAELVLPAIRADFAWYEAYEGLPGAVLSCPVTAFAGRADDRVPLADVEAWQDTTTGPFTLRLLDGGHFLGPADEAAVLGAVAADWPAAG